ncbi:MAG TPA: YicC family protein, partial [Thermoanaerobacterales bacterium]|nr:YicC family protein [Thermoanaerobacterales bacterium]
MVLSMTGYGKGTGSDEDISFQTEIRSVNHRYNDIRIRLPVSNIILEEKIKGLVRDKISRGKVDIHITMEISKKLKEKLIYVDSTVIRAYYNAVEELMSELGIEGKTDLSFLFTLPETIKTHEPPLEEDEIWHALEISVNEALESLLEMREREGLELKKDIVIRIDKISKITEEINKRAYLVVDYYRERLKSKIEEILENPSELNSERLETEVAIMTDKSDITEEITRIYSHIRQFNGTLNSGEPKGRKLDFIIQELNREINTIGSKSNDVKIS